MFGICEMSASSARVSEVAAMVPGIGFVCLPAGIGGRKGEVLSSRDPRGGEEVKAFDAIDSISAGIPLSCSEVNHPKCFRERRGQISCLE